MPCSSNGAAPKDQSAYPAGVPQGILSAWLASGAVCWHPQSSLLTDDKTAIMGFSFKLRLQELSPPMQWTSPVGAAKSGQLMHLDYQYYAGDSHQFLVGIAHRLTLLASSLAPCWGDHDSWDEWLLMELRHRYLSLCGLAVHLHAVHASIGDLDACYDPGRTYMMAAPERPPCSSEEAVAVLYVRVRVEGFYDEGAVWCLLLLPVVL